MPHRASYSEVLAGLCSTWEEMEGAAELSQHTLRLGVVGELGKFLGSWLKHSTEPPHPPVDGDRTSVATALIVAACKLSNQEERFNALHEFVVWLAKRSLQKLPHLPRHDFEMPPPRDPSSPLRRPLLRPLEDALDLGDPGDVARAMTRRPGDS